MSTIGYDRSLSYLRASSADFSATPRPAPAPALTLSRETGSRGSAIARLVADSMAAKACPPGGKWPVFDKAIVGRALEEHGLAADLETYVPEDKVRLFRSAFEEMLGLHPPADDLVKATNETVRCLARLGNVVIIGRGGNFLTDRMPNVLRVRIVAPLPARVLRIRERFQLTETEATEFVRRSDKARERYIAGNFHAAISDPLRYDLVLNTGRLAPAECTAVICAALERMPASAG